MGMQKLLMLINQLSMQLWKGSHLFFQKRIGKEKNKGTGGVEIQEGNTVMIVF